MRGKYSGFAFCRYIKVVFFFKHQNRIGLTKWYCLFLRTTHVFMSFEWTVEYSNSPTHYFYAFSFQLLSAVAFMG